MHARAQRGRADQLEVVRMKSRLGAGAPEAAEAGDREPQTLHAIAAAEESRVRRNRDS